MRTRFHLVATLFLLSGGTGLLYEVAFSKLLGYVFGATAYAVSAVLAAFMAGLALGAHFGGRAAARFARPLVVYGVLEVVVGFVCALSPAALDLLTHAYIAVARAAPGSLAALTAARSLLTGLVVVVPTIAMGATLPVLSRLVAGSSAPKARLAQLYAINTAGGALGALGGAYAVLPELGIRGTMLAAAATNVAIGLVALAVGWRERGGASEESRAAQIAAADPEAPPLGAAGRDTARGGADGILPVLAFASGFLVFATEVVGTHLLALLIGNSAYAFGLMLAVFLVCLAAGAARAPAFARRHGPHALPRSLAAAALFVAATMPLWVQLPRVFLFAGKHVHTWAGRELVRAAAALVILAAPTVWMGTTFPLLLQHTAGRTDVAARVGRLVAVNTFGTIAGSIATGYFVLPALGSQGTLRAIALILAVLALATARASRLPLLAKRAPEGAVAAAAAAVALGAALPGWDLARLTNGANVYFAAGPPPDRIAFVREDVHGGVTTVAVRGAVTTMYTNGKFQGDDGPEMAAQRRFAHFPSLFVRRHDRVLVIGLGTGTTLGTIAAYPWRHIDAAEISPAIVEAARAFFPGPNLGALDDPRVRLELNDGRNVLLVSTEPYDLVTIELTSVWFAGAAALYSRELYELAASRLAADGVLQQWVQLHHIHPRELATIVRTLRAVMPHVALFVGGAQGILVAGKKPLVASAAALADLERLPSLRATLGGKRPAEFLSELVSSGEDLDRFVRDAEAESGPIVSTDDSLYLEYATPKGNVLSYDASLRATLDVLERYRTRDPQSRHLGP